MREKVQWGVMGVSKFATTKMIPALLRCEWAEVAGIASRDEAKAKSTAAGFGIRKAYGSYEELLADPEIEVIYNPLPNHMHVPWSIRAAEAAKHVLCEKPISLSVAECRKLIEARDRTGVKIGEAFMVRTHPQWLRAREIVRSGEIGQLRAVMASFSFFNRDPKNIRNLPQAGGGALMDIGCYAIQTSRFLFGEEPSRVVSLLDRDPEMGIDRISSAILDFPSGQAVFTCSMQFVPYQKLQAFGAKGRLELEIPFNAPPDRPARLFVDSGADLFGGGLKTEEFAPCDQYTIQGDLFSKAVRGGGDVPTPLEDSIKNMAVIEALYRSAKDNTWGSPGID
jgi:predicted dehydrogenase